MIQGRCSPWNEFNHCSTSEQEIQNAVNICEISPQIQNSVYYEFDLSAKSINLNKSSVFSAAPPFIQRTIFKATHSHFHQKNPKINIV